MCMHWKMFYMVSGQVVSVNRAYVIMSKYYHNLTRHAVQHSKDIMHKLVAIVQHLFLGMPED